MSTRRLGMGSQTDEFFQAASRSHKTSSGQTDKHCGSRKLNPASKSGDTEALGRKDQELPELRFDWNWVKFCCGCQTPEVLPMKAGKSISNIIMNAGNML